MNTAGKIDPHDFVASRPEPGYSHILPMSTEDAPTSTLAHPIAPEAQVGAFHLTVTNGSSAGMDLVLDEATPSRVLVGTSPACMFRLVDPTVSRRHASFEVSAEGLRVSDLGSRNGTFVGGVRVVEAILRGGETVHVGATSVAITRAEPPTNHAADLPTRFGEIVGASLEMRKLFPLCERLAAAMVTVIVEGETGTGKEVLARALHEVGPRGNGPFVVFDCTAVPPNLVESELFGHERGAFTGAISTRKGVFEQAHGGTLLIDEIGDLEASLQPKLLRVLERGEVRRVGGDRALPVDVRVLAATRRDLDHEVEAGRFRDDLFHRLAVARIELPPLRKRHGDVHRLAVHFCRELGGDESQLGSALLARWESYGWPGNVRELKNAVARQLALGELAAHQRPRERERTSHPPPAPAPVTSVDFIDSVLVAKPSLADGRQRVVEEFEQRYLDRVLDEHGGNVTRAAEASGIARRHFYRLRARGGQR